MKTKIESQGGGWERMLGVIGADDGMAIENSPTVTGG